MKDISNINKDINFLIIDGSSMLVRAYFASAFRSKPQVSPKGVYTNGVVGFLNMMLRAIEQFQPTHLFVAWDVSRDTFRRELYPAYKGTRGELPDELHPQFETMQRVLDSLGVAQHSDERYEADDIIGTLAVQAANASHEVMILTGDHDALQLVDTQITVAIMKKGITELQFYTPTSLLDEWGLTAEQIVDLKGLMGDTSDNIPGIPGIGEKTAKKLLTEYQSIENVIANKPLIKGKLGEKIEQHQEIALLSKQLATIIRNIPLPYAPAHCRLSLKLETASELLRDLGLQRTLNQLERIVRAG